MGSHGANESDVAKVKLMQSKMTERASMGNLNRDSSNRQCDGHA